MAANAETASPQHSKQTQSIKIENEIIECQPYSVFKTKYNQQLSEFYGSHVTQLKKAWTTKRVLEVIQQIKLGKQAMISGNRRTSMQYYWNSKYDVVISDETKKEYLVVKKKKPNDLLIRIIPTEQYFDLLFKLHNELDHGGRDKITNAVKSKYYVQKKGIELFVALCPICDEKRSNLRKKVATKFAIANFNSHGLLDIIDFQAKPDEDYKWVLKYQDRATKFIHIRPLKTDEASEISLELVKIFLTFGAPTVLFSHDVKILNNIMKLWPQCNIIHGSSRPEIDENSELSKKDIEIILQTWMEENSSSNWSLGCYFVQYEINTTNNFNDEKSSYRHLFGTDPKCMEQSKNDTDDHNEVNILTQKEAKNLKESETTQNISVHNAIDIKLEVDVEEEEPSEETCSEDFSQVFVHQVNVKTENDEEDYKKEEVAVETRDTSISEAFDHHEIFIKTENVEVEQSGEEITIHNNSQYNEVDQETNKNVVNQGVKRFASEIIVKKKQKTCPSDLNVGDTVKIGVPVNDRGPSDLQFVTGKIITCHDGFYQVGTNAGIIKDWFHRHELIKSNPDCEEDILLFPLVSFKQAVTDQSTMKSQK